MRTKQHSALYLMMILLIGVLLSCGRAREEKEYRAVVAEDSTLSINDDNTLEETFITDTLNEEQLNVFQQRGRQKAQDFINYIEIISNKTYNSQLRLVARKQIEELFADSTMITVSIDEKEKNPLPLPVFLNRVYDSRYDSIKIKTDSVVVSHPQKTNEEAGYAGSINAKVTIVGYKNAQASFNSCAVHTVNIVIRKTRKDFGEDSKMIWTVSLGEMK